MTWSQKENPLSAEEQEKVENIPCLNLRLSKNRKAPIRRAPWVDDSPNGEKI